MSDLQSDPVAISSQMSNIVNFFDDTYLTIYSELLNVELNDQLNFLKLNYLCNLNSDSKILDLCCGNGRHLCLLNNKYLVDGIDINSYNISKAKANMPQNAHGKLYTADATTFKQTYKYNFIYCLENSIGYLSDSETLTLFMNISNNLSSKQGKMVIHFTNKDFLVKNLSHRIWFGNTKNGYLLEQRKLDSLHGNVTFEQIRILKNKEKHCSITLRLYTFHELKYLLKQANLKITNVYGDFLSNSYTVESPAMILEIVHI